MSDMHRGIAVDFFGETRNLISKAGERGWRAAAGAGAGIRTELLDAAGLVWLDAAAAPHCLLRF